MEDKQLIDALRRKAVGQDANTTQLMLQAANRLEDLIAIPVAGVKTFPQFDQSKPKTYADVAAEENKTNPNLGG